LDEALEAAKEAAAAWIDAALDAKTTVPTPSTLQDIRCLPGYEGWTIGVIELDPGLFDDSIERVNITLPKRVLRRLDDLASARHQSRGAFISELTMRL
jgi:hypothetical protein